MQEHFKPCEFTVQFYKSDGIYLKNNISKIKTALTAVHIVTACGVYNCQLKVKI